MTRLNRNRFVSAAGVVAVALSLTVASEAVSARQANQIAARPDTAVLVAAADERLLAQRIEQALEQDDAVDAKDIAVTVTNGVVELTGTVRSAEELRAAQDIAYARGALVVDNKLQIPGWGDMID